MMRSLFSGISGLKGHQTRMDVVGHNISNVNTTGFKASRVTFADTLYQTTSGSSAPQGNLGGINPKQIGLGANVASIDTVFGDASVQGTGKNTDVALAGNGLFMVKNNSGTYYTRSGAFEFDANGNYVMSGNGSFVQGWMARENGELVTTEQPGNITIKAGKSMQPQMTTSATYLNNLNADTKGYEIASIIAKYKDGTQKSLASYKQGNVGVMSLGTDKGRSVTLDDDVADYKFTTNDHLCVPGATKGRALFKTTVTSLNPNGHNIGLTLKKNPDSFSIQQQNGTTFSDIEFDVNTGGPYSIGQNFTITGEIDKNGVTTHGSDPGVTELTLKNAKILNPDGTVLKTLTNKVKVKVPPPKDFTYQDGDTPKFGMSISKMEAEEKVKVATPNTYSNGAKLDGNECTSMASSANFAATKRYVVTKNDQEYIYRGRLNGDDGKVKSVTRTSKEEESVTLTMKDGQVFTAATNGEYKVGGMYYPPSVTTFTVYDSLGGAHSVPLTFRKTGANEWDMNLGSSDTYTYKEKNGMEVTATLTKTKLKFDQTGRYVSGDATVSMTYKREGEEEPKTHKVTVSLGALTQYNGSSTIKAESDGNAEGVLKSVSIDKTGTITGVYSNGKIKAEAQLAVAQFNNPAGLTRAGGNFFEISNNSGAANVKTAADLGCTITPSALEMSNVDIADQFSDMIVTQRGFQANSKTITVGDEMLETLINMKR